ncbi:hypothetical protein Tco_0802276 [Tanacetum coccineum]|uniref:Uncharacterized protein n=1 Tax=Tanacetum coccineum TaxID=301880 RepID=A0ABQ4ZYI4_9ASTR
MNQPRTISEMWVGLLERNLDGMDECLEHTTADLSRNTCAASPESIQNQESEKSSKEIIRIKKEQGEEKQDSTYSIKSTDKVDLEEFDLKSALFKHMNKNKSANRNLPTTIYTMLYVSFIAYEDAIDKKALQLDKTRVGQTKRRVSDTGQRLVQLQPPLKDNEPISKKTNGVLMHLLPNNIQLLTINRMADQVVVYGDKPSWVGTNRIRNRIH